MTVVSGKIVYYDKERDVLVVDVNACGKIQLHDFFVSAMEIEKESIDAKRNENGFWDRFFYKRFFNKFLRNKPITVEFNERIDSYVLDETTEIEINGKSYRKPIDPSTY